MAWKCAQCGTIHGSNPSQCRSCGHPILSLASPSEVRENAEGIDSPEAMNLDDVSSGTSSTESNFSGARSPDVALDGSIDREEPEPIEPEPTPSTDGEILTTRRAIIGTLGLGALGAGGAVATGRIDVPGDPGGAAVDTGEGAVERIRDIGPAIGEKWDREVAVQAAYERTDAARETEGWTALPSSDALEAVAQEFAERMVAEDFFAHEAPDGSTVEDRYRRSGISCDRSGEVLAQTYWLHEFERDGETIVYNEPAELGTGVVEGWLDSPPHRELVLNPEFVRQGIGMAKTTDNVVYAVQNFC